MAAHRAPQLLRGRGARSASTLRLAIGGRSGSAANLRRTGHATVLLFDAGLVHYIKGKAREQRPSMQCSPWNAVFDVTVTDVLADAVGPAPRGRVVRARRRDRSLRSVVGRPDDGGARRAPVRHPPMTSATPRRLIVGITGASGSIYGIRLLERLRTLDVETHLVLSRWGARTLVHETSYTVEQVQRLATRDLRLRRTRARPSRAGRSSRWG